MVLKVLGAVGTGIGILGFVTFFGGAILWLRAKEAGLPANDAVSVIPNSVLVTTGASFLVPAVLIAAGAVAAIFVVHLVARLERAVPKRSAIRDAAELHHGAEKLARAADAAEQVAKAVRTQAVALTEAAELLGKDSVADQAAKDQAAQEAATRRQQASEREAEALIARSTAVAKKVQADDKEAEYETVLERTPGSSIRSSCSARSCWLWFHPGSTAPSSI